jgi:hypothetical protein
VKTEAPSLQCFQLHQNFFGLDAAHRAVLHNNLFELVWWGDGRWTLNDVYEMSVPMRRFWVKKLNEKLNPPKSPKPKKQPKDKIAKPDNPYIYNKSGK